MCDIIRRKIQYYKGIKILKSLYRRTINKFFGIDQYNIHQCIWNKKSYQCLTFNKNPKKLHFEYK